jgi:hypothetical protein
VGLDRAIAESGRLFQLLRKKSRRYQEASPGGGFYFESNDSRGEQQCRIVAGRHTVMVFWRQAYTNVVDGSTLRVVYLPGIIPFNLGQTPPSQRLKHPLREKTYSFDLGPGEQPQWKADKTFYATDDLVQEIFTLLIEKVKQPSSQPEALIRPGPARYRKIRIRAASRHSSEWGAPLGMMT